MLACLAILVALLNTPTEALLSSSSFAAIPSSPLSSPILRPTPAGSSPRSSPLFGSGSDDDEEPSGPFSFLSKAFAELDNFVDDATARRLGNGAQYYGKRKSSFYGKDDSMKKTSKKPSPLEDYQGPTNTGYFVWKKDEATGKLQPQTRMKGKVIETNQGFWDKFFAKEEEEERKKGGGK
jgi:hypothetical protein